ncbi:hypothetical protein OG777_11145 [Micromonospora peucetia]|uniref:Tryptophan-associated transmembrane protein (Trp_oprn_chp) n=1 Tax=Micromonospora peucetia TaxID=47871 RepID=A0A1C6UTR4_9ACTN|nr:hypothetical protein [Micromonospora peucetia]MCX4387485.1 hypothetical protein [Micromonospora peucetia]WSA34808.1 hypothetical protein OIE14_12565 [Micromonospora peucetia]SCL57417.1 hypothetical protein GA0070608_1818 [Micromonospora peucetia]
MSYPDRTPARRPAVVTAAVAVLALMAVAALAYAAVGAVTRGGTVDRFRAASADTSASPDQIDTVATLLGVSTVLTAVVSLLAGLLLAGLALGLRAGRDGARTATWVVSGLGLLAGCCGLTLLVGQRALPLGPDENDRATAELFNLLADAYPSWWIPLGTGLSVGQVLGYLVVAVLLALPGASAWFRRRPAPSAPHHAPASPAPPPVPPSHQPPAPPYPPR